MRVAADSLRCQISPVGGAYDDDGAPIVQAVHEAEHGRHHAGEHLVGAGRAQRHERVQLVQEDDGGRPLLRLPPAEDTSGGEQRL